jgi:hypothetical protein
VKDIADDGLMKFQAKVNESAGSDFLKFTAKAWGEDKEMDIHMEQSQSKKKNVFHSFLDMEMFWSVEAELNFGVHLKNQQLKYLNRGSTHMARIVFSSDSIRSVEAFSNVYYEEESESKKYIACKST